MSLNDEGIATNTPKVGAQVSSEPALRSEKPEAGVSFVSGNTDAALRHVTISQLLRDTVAQFGSRDALVFSATSERYSYNDFDRDVDEVATGFLAAGLDKGDRVGIWSPNRYEWILTQFATARIGVVLVNINPAYRLSEVEYAVNKVGCKALVLSEQFKSSCYLSMIQQLAPELKRCEKGELMSSRLPSLKTVVLMSNDTHSGIYSFNELKNLGGPAQVTRLQAIESTLNPDDPINVQFTSGTTGAPKGATLSHHNIVNNARFVTDRINLTESDRLCIPVPLYHCFGMVMGVLGAVSKGAAMVFPGEGFEPVPTLNTLSAERCTALYGVPTMFISMLHEMKSITYDLSNLRTGVMAGAPCPIEVMERVNSEMNMGEVTICYGMTETSPVSFQSFVDDPTDKRCSTVGRIHPHLDVKIINEAGQIVAVGDRGELCTRGYSVMTGYWDDEEQTSACIIDGWMHTGDLATLDESGFCTIVGRVKDMIIRGGENIYPREIEEFLFRHPNINQVQIFGIPDEKLGEIVCAWVVPKPGDSISEESVRMFCDGQIAHYKIPHHIRIVDEIPMTITGKPQKFIMRDQMVEALL